MVLSFSWCLDRIVQQESITAAHHLDAVGDQAASLVLARVDLEILLGAAKAEQDFGDGAIALAAKASIQRAQRQDMPLPELGRQGPKIGTGWAASERAPETAGGVSAQFKKGIHRQGGGIEGRGVGNGLGQPELMRNAVDLPDAMPPIRRSAQIKTVEMRQRDDWLRLVVAILHCGEHYRLRLEARIPEQGLPIGWSFRIGWKIATPNAARRFPDAPGLARSK